jgi:DNA-binding transcriptional MerR regulator
METLSIGKTAQALGVSIATLRKWADSGLVPSIKLPSGYRRWTRQQVAEIKAEMFDSAGAKAG